MRSPSLELSLRPPGRSKRAGARERIHFTQRKPTHKCRRQATLRAAPGRTDSRRIVAAYLTHTRLSICKHSHAQNDVVASRRGDCGGDCDGECMGDRGDCTGESAGAHCVQRVMPHTTHLQNKVVFSLIIGGCGEMLAAVPSVHNGINTKQRVQSGHAIHTCANTKLLRAARLQ
jgi:hypothetical protein